LKHAPFLLMTLALVVAPSARGEEVLAHDVYFELKDDTPATRKALVDACRKYLTGHPGIVSFAAGAIAEEMARPVNDRAWDVALHIYFKDTPSHDAYQDAPRHKQFIAEQQANWKTVRVFDSRVELSR
jgi:hypothetical protein